MNACKAAALKHRIYTVEHLAINRRPKAVRFTLRLQAIRGLMGLTTGSDIRRAARRWGLLPEKA